MAMCDQERTTNRDYGQLVGRWLHHPQHQELARIEAMKNSRVGLSFMTTDRIDYVRPEYVDEFDLLDSAPAVVHRFRPRTSEIEAVRLDADNADAVAEWCGGEVTRDAGRLSHSVHLETVEGYRRARVGDRVYRDVHGGFHVDQDGPFDARFEEVPGQTSPWRVILPEFTTTNPATGTSSPA